jgi:hypothetical protein
VPLPVHDSFIVQAVHNSTLRDLDHRAGTSSMYKHCDLGSCNDIDANSDFRFRPSRRGRLTPFTARAGMQHRHLLRSSP